MPTSNPIQTDLPRLFRHFPVLANQELSALALQAQAYLNLKLADSTLDVYLRAWRGFCRWCETYGLLSLPAEVSTIVLYLTWLAERHLTLSTIRCQLAAIKMKHDEGEYPPPTQSPIIKSLLQGIIRTYGAPQMGVTALLPDTLR